jgi:hypothetical protein
MSKLPLPKFIMPDIPSFPSSLNIKLSDDLKQYVADNIQDVSINDLQSESVLLPASDTSSF